MKHWINLKGKFTEWKKEILNHKKVILISLSFLIIASILDYFSGNYVDNISENIAVQDILLDNLPIVNLEFIFSYGYLIIITIIFLYPLFINVKDLHTTIIQFSLLTIIRAIFISLTHLKVPVDAIAINFPWIISHLSFKNDLFFSGHVAFSFLGFFLFRKEKIRFLFLTATIIFSITVLLMHIHYSIDVFSAYFIAYGSYKIGNKILNKFNNNKK